MGSSAVVESYAPLLDSPAPSTSTTSSNKLRVWSLVLSGMLVLVFALAGLIYTNPGLVSGLNLQPEPVRTDGRLQDFSWTNEMLSWQRTGFHFQPEKNFQSDPNAPMYYKGWYHFFYQYNPNGTYWDFSISWGHAVSRDLIHWLILPLAMQPDHWYDIRGTWTGTATLLPDGHIVVLYTGGTKELVQVQNLAVPADPNDPLLLKWNKYNANPILRPPPGIGDRDFRDPFPIWLVYILPYINFFNKRNQRLLCSSDTWRILIGSKNADYYGIVLLYNTKDFMNYTLLPNLLHTTAEKVGMLECVDLYPLATASSQSGNAQTFSLQNIPRTVLFDTKTGSNLLFWPVEEVEALRTSQKEFSDITVGTGSTHELNVGEAFQLDIEAEFEINKDAIEATVEADVTYNCSTSGGASNRGQLGPFGLLTLANKMRTEQTATYFYITRRLDGSLRTHF